MAQSFEEREASIDKDRQSTSIGVVGTAILIVLVVASLFAAAWALM